MKVLVVTVGAVLEWTGIILIASPELAPWSARLRVFSRRVFGRGRARVRRFFRRARHVEGRSSVSGGGAIRAEGRVGGATLRSMGLTVDERLDYLVEEVGRLRGRLRETEIKLAEHPGEWRREITESEGRLQTLMEEKVAAVRDAHIRVRLWGIVLVLAGLPLLAWANFL